jgi:WhiB family redox-sensing transcriptional regulator
MADTRHLSRPATAAWDRQLHGACRGMNTEFFHHPDGERGSVRARRDEDAKAVCLHCPVLAECSRYTLPRTRRISSTMDAGNSDRVTLS